LAYFRRWWANVGPGQGWLLHRDDLERYECYLREDVTGKWTQKPLSYHSRNDALRRLRQALGWAWNKGYTDRDYSKWVPEAHGGPARRRSVPLIVLRKIMRAAGMTAHPARDRAILAVLIGMGLRRLECVNLNVQDVIVEADGSGYATVKGKRTKANQTGMREAAFDSATGRYLCNYLDVISHRCGALFRGQTGVRLGVQGVYRVVRSCAEAAGVSAYVSGCHDLRRAFATHYARSRKGEISGDLLRRQLGHADYSMTSQYTLHDIDDIRADIVSPLALMLGSELDDD
jgi:integrase